MPYAYKPFDLMVMEMTELMDENDKLKLENAKLRKFATLAWQVLIRNEPLLVWQGMVNDARELGIKEA